MSPRAAGTIGESPGLGNSYYLVQLSAAGICDSQDRVRRQSRCPMDAAGLGDNPDRLDSRARSGSRPRPHDGLRVTIGWVRGANGGRGVGPDDAVEVGWSAGSELDAGALAPVGDGESVGGADVTDVVSPEAPVPRTTTVSWTVLAGSDSTSWATNWVPVSRLSGAPPDSLLTGTQFVA